MILKLSKTKLSLNKLGLNIIIDVFPSEVLILFSVAFVRGKMEGCLRSVDPLAYYMNVLSDFDPEVVQAYKSKDNAKIKQLASTGKMDMDLFVCVNKEWHAFILCAPKGDSGLGYFFDVVESPFDIPTQLICWQYELVVESEELQWYKIRKECKLFKNIEGKIQLSFYIGRFEGLSLNALQFVAMRSAPHVYKIIVEDCVTFAENFCVHALQYCSNRCDLEEEVRNNIAKATANGFSVENLSRNVRSSGWVGRTFMGGIDVSGLLSNRFRVASAVCLFLLLYTIIVAVITVKVVK